MFYVYIFQHKQSHKIYVGKTADFSYRVTKHKQSARYPKTYFHKALSKYGINEFNYSIIEEWETETESFEAEQFWIEFFRSNYSNYGYNLTKGGEGSSGYKHRPETIAKFSGKNNSQYGVKHSAERKKITSINTTRINLQQHALRSAVFSGERNPKVKLKAKDVEDIKLAIASGETQKSIAKRYNVTQSLISKIKLGLLWKS